MLHKRYQNKKGWSGGIWVPKKLCSLEESKEQGVGILTMPLWLYKKLEI